MSRTRSWAACSASCAGSLPPARDRSDPDAVRGAGGDVDGLRTDGSGRAEQHDVARSHRAILAGQPRRNASTTTSGHSAWSAVSNRSASPSGPLPCVAATQPSRASETSVAAAHTAGPSGPGGVASARRGGGRPEGEHDERDGRSRDVHGRRAVLGLGEDRDHDRGQPAGGQDHAARRAQGPQAECGDDVGQAQGREAQRHDPALARPVPGQRADRLAHRVVTRALPGRGDPPAADQGERGRHRRAQRPDRGAGHRRCSVCGPSASRLLLPDSASARSMSASRQRSTCRTPVVPAEREPVHPRPPDERRLCPERDRLEHVGPGAHAGVEEDLGAVADGVDDAGQRVQRADRAVDLAAAVVGHDDGVHAGVDGAARVIGVLDALQHDRAVPVVADESEVLPGVVGAGEHRQPAQHRRLQIVLGRLLQPGQEDRIGEVRRQTLAGEEGQVGVVEIARTPAQHPGVEGDDQGREVRPPWPGTGSSRTRLRRWASRAGTSGCRRRWPRRPLRAGATRPWKGSSAGRARHWPGRPRARRRDA